MKENPQPSIFTPATQIIRQDPCLLGIKCRFVRKGYEKVTRFNPYRTNVENRVSS